MYSGDGTTHTRRNKPLEQHEKKWIDHLEQQPAEMKAEKARTRDK